MIKTMETQIMVDKCMKEQWKTNNSKSLFKTNSEIKIISEKIEQMKKESEEKHIKAYTVCPRIDKFSKILSKV